MPSWVSFISPSLTSIFSVSHSFLPSFFSSVYSKSTRSCILCPRLLWFCACFFFFFFFTRLSTAAEEPHHHHHSILVSDCLLSSLLPLLHPPICSPRVRILSSPPYIYSLFLLNHILTFLFPRYCTSTFPPPNISPLPKGNRIPCP